MDYSVVVAGKCPLFVRNGQGHNASTVITLPIVSLEKKQRTRKSKRFRAGQTRPVKTNQASIRIQIRGNHERYRR
jgi:hypothetical protein